MKTSLLLFLWLNIFQGVCQEESALISIKGRIPEITKGEMLLLAQTSKGIDTLGRADITPDGFTLEAPLTKAYVATLRVAGYEGGFIMIAEPGAVYEAKLYSSSPGSILGGRQQNELTAYQETVSRYKIPISKLSTEIELATKERRFKSVSELNKNLDHMGKEAQNQLDSIVERNRGSVFAAYILTEGMKKRELNEMEANYSRLNAEERSTQPGMLYASYIADLKSLNVDSVAPDFRLSDPEGNQVSLQNLSGKLKIIDFWASWCGPCRMENPNMVKLYNDFKEKGLTVVSVSLDEKRNAWLKAIKDDGLEWIQLSSLEGWKSSVVQQYNIDAVPTIFILNENNRIVAKNLRGEKLREFVSNYLK